MQKRGLLVVLAIALVLAHSACGGAAPGPTATAELTNTPTPPATTGQVKGILVGKAGGAPTQASVLLTPVTVKSDGSFNLPLDFIATAEKGESSSSGEFLFEDLEPGQYILTAMIGGGGMGATLMDEQGEPVIIEVKAGQVIDLGRTPVR